MFADVDNSMTIAQEEIFGRECGPEGISGYCESKSVLLPFGYTPE